MNDSDRNSGLGKAINKAADFYEKHDGKILVGGLGLAFIAGTFLPDLVDVKKANDALEKSQKVVSELEQNVASLEESLQVANSDKEAAEAYVLEKQESIDEFEERKTAMEAEATALDEKISRLEFSEIELKRELTESERFSELLKADMAKTNIMVETVKQGFHDYEERHDAELEALEQSLERYKTSYKLLEAEVFSTEELRLFRDQRGIVDAINEKLDKLEIVRLPGPIVGSRSRAMYFVREKQRSESAQQSNGLFHFNAKEYSIRDASLLPLTDKNMSLFAQGICDVAKWGVRGSDELVSFSEALSIVERQYNSAGISLVENPSLSILIEFEYIVYLLLQKFTSASILLQGYADAASGDWRLPADSSFKSEAVHAYIRTERATDYYADETITASLSEIEEGEDFYRNRHLPNLRSASVKKSLLELASSCDDEYEIEVLEGRELEVRDSRQRYVFAYLSVSL